MTSSKRILVTGGAGFLGFHLTELLLQQGHHVTAIDNLFTGRESNLAPLKEKYGDALVFRKEDVRQLSFDEEVDEIFNLACPASPPYYQKDPIGTTETCVIGALKLLALAQKYNAKIMQASTSEVYGDAQVHPQPETYWGNVNPDGPRACYDEGKRCAESIFFDHHRLFGTRIKVVRIFNSYGPMMQPGDGRVVSNFCRQAIKGEPLTIFGDGAQTRSFCYCKDTVRGFRALMDSDDDFIGPVNIGNPGEFTILELAEKVLKLTGSKSEIVRMPLPVNDPKVRRPDITLAKEKLHWSPTISLDEGLPPTIDFFQQFPKSQLY